jgi:two-component system OmpR family sensor kinase
MTSIRARLLGSLLGALICAGLVAAVGVYLKAWQEVNILFDYQLKQIALSLRDHAVAAAAVASSDRDDAAHDVIIQIWDDEGLHLYQSHTDNLPTPQAQPGWSTVAMPQGGRRIFTLVEEERTIQVEQSLQVRQDMATGMAVRMLLPWLLTLPALAGLIWWLVGRSLKPLTAIASAVSRRTALALEPLADTGLPQEVQPLVTALNALMQRLAATLVAQRSFIADAAHTLRTPLTAIHLQAQLLTRSTVDEECQQTINALQCGVQRATRLVNQLLTLARLDPDNTQPHLVSLELNPLLHDIIADHALSAAEKAIDLGLAHDDPARVVGDADSLRWMFDNLLENAIRYTPAGGTVDVLIIHASDAVSVEVVDTGPGIPPEDRERVLDRFYRRDTTNGSGSGLGLAIVKATAMQHHAQLVLDTPPCGSGLVVRITFPCA